MKFFSLITSGCLDSFPITRNRVIFAPGSSSTFDFNICKLYVFAASSLAAQTYNLQILKSNVEDEPGANITRFLVMGKESKHPEFIKEKNFITSCVFQLKSIPSALYKALGSFSGYGINLCRLESFSLKNTFRQVAFYIEIEKHIEDPIMQKALEELGFHTQEMTILGCYPASSYRLNN